MPVDFGEGVDFGEIVRRGRIWSPPVQYEHPPFSVLVVALTYTEAEQLARQLNLGLNEYFCAWPNCPSFGGLVFQKVYVVDELAPNLRTDEEEEWFAKMHRDFTGSFSYVELTSY